MNEIEKLYIHYTGNQPDNVTALHPVSGSNRRYFRLKGAKNMIGVIGTSVDENNAFIYIASHFRDKGLPVPEIYCYSADKLRYLQEDLGDVLLFNAIEQGRQNSSFDHDVRQLLHKTISWLPSMQVIGAEGFDFSRCLQPEFDSRTVMWDLNYFKYCFLKTTGIDFQESRLEDDFNHLCHVLLQDRCNTFLYRDFQSRNIMIKGDEPYFIDFQGGRKGPVFYDVASFLWQAKANFSKELREELLSSYFKALKVFIQVDENDFRKQLRHFVLFRTLQTLGAYGFRGYFEKKSHFIQSIPFAFDNLRELLHEDFAGYPYLCELLRKLTRNKDSVFLQNSVLEVKIISFAYKKGIPADSSGNGGGFVFDCRAINNPAQYERFKTLTGLDDPVIRFFEEETEAYAFMENVCSLVDKSIQCYNGRGFTSLMVCFGCTGGQHRSVYCTQQLATYLYKKYEIKITMIHRELNYSQTYNHIIP